MTWRLETSDSTITFIPSANLSITLHHLPLNPFSAPRLWVSLEIGTTPYQMSGLASSQDISATAILSCDKRVKLQVKVACA